MIPLRQCPFWCPRCLEELRRRSPRQRVSPRSETGRRAIAISYHRQPGAEMGFSERSARSLSTIVGHVEHVCSVAEGATPPPGIEAVSSSWQRSAKKYGLDPIDSKAPRILTPAELKYFCEPSPPPPRTTPRRAKFPNIETPLPAYVRRDARLRRPSYHRTSRCSGAPVFGVDGRLIAVLDVSAIDPELSERAHALTGALTVRSARDRRAIFS